jgi:hypothetical protein
MQEVLGQTTGVCIGSGANDASFACNSEFDRPDRRVGSMAAP